MNIACVIMAAGAARRFGGDKIFARFEGEMLYARAIRAAQTAGCFTDIALVCRLSDVPRIHAPGVRLLVNETGARSRTIQLGAEAFSGCDAIVFMTCDQPLLTAESLQRLAAAFEAEPDGICALGVSGKPRNPALFARRFFEELHALEGEDGGKKVIRAHAGAVRVVEAPACELTDADTPQALEELVRLAGQTRPTGIKA